MAHRRDSVLVALRAGSVLALRAGAALLVCLAACSPRPEHEPPSVLLVTIDTLRADHLGSYGYARDTSPRLDALAAEGLAFADVSSPRAKTTPAVVSMLTGLYPHDHGVRDLAAPLPADGPRLLQEALGAAGWTTAAVIGNWVLTDERSGLARGFDLWVEELPDVRGVPPHAAPQRTAASLSDAAIELLERPELAGRFFLWLHYMDPHGAYEAPEEHRLFRAAEPDWIPREDELPPSRLHAFRLADYNVPAEAVEDGRVDAARVRDLYDAEIRYVDAELGRVLDHLRAGGRLDDTLVLVTADHGESLGEHRYWFEHGSYAYQATCRVPLIVRWPRAREGLLRGWVSAPVSLADVAPTVLELAGLPPLPSPSSPAHAGRSLLELCDPTRAARREPVVFLEKVERAELDRAVQIKAARVGRWKLVRRYAHVTRGGARELAVLSDELYDLEEDPLEARDLSATPPPEAPLSELEARLLAFTAADRAFPELDLVLQRQREALAPEVLRTLEALGY